jgi:DNA-binding transcriptional MerR regulator
MTVGELAEKTGVGAKTLRYYEDIELLVPRRTPAGWRDYDDTALLVLKLTAVGKRMGLRLSEIVRFVGLFRDPAVSNDAVATRLEPHRTRLDTEIANLIEARSLLDSLVKDCPFRRC